jgi:hypothetical protein
MTLRITGFVDFFHTLVSAIHRLTNSIWNKEKLWKESNIIPVCRKDDATDCNNYCGISLLPVSYERLSNILLSRLSPCIDEIIGDNQCRFQLTD